MRVTFIGHSGFLAETEDAALLFDWWKGPLPEIALGLPLYVFASHRHEDHFNPKIFALDDGTREIAYILGHDIRLTPRNLDRWGISTQTAEKCYRLKGGQACKLPHAGIEALNSTDEGAAFLVTSGERTIFHAGDLNWWHWDGEDKSWNNNMAANFRKYTEPLRDRAIDLAMLPLDPRLKEWGYWGPEYFLELADIKKFLPMHQWNDFSFTEKFLEAHPECADRTIPVTKEGQTFTI